MLTNYTVLDCGHKPSQHSSITTGYSTDDAGKKYCYECSLVKEKEQAWTTGHMFAYVGASPLKTGQPWSLISWPGTAFMRCDFTPGGTGDTCSFCGRLADHANHTTPVEVVKIGSKYGFNGSHIHYVRFYWRGKVWSGTTLGPGMYLKARRLKKQPKGGALR